MQSRWLARNSCQGIELSWPARVFASVSRVRASWMRRASVACRVQKGRAPMLVNGGAAYCAAAQRSMRGSVGQSPPGTQGAHVPWLSPFRAGRQEGARAEWHRACSCWPSNHLKAAGPERPSLPVGNSVCFSRDASRTVTRVRDVPAVLGGCELQFPWVCASGLRDAARAWA